MAFNVSDKSSGRNFDPIPEGIYIGTCYMIVDIGTHEHVFSGKAKTIREVIVGFEIPDERIDIEKNGKMESLPRVISQKYTASLNEKANLRKMLKSWRGRDFTKEELEAFDLKNVLSKSCQIQVLHTEANNGKVYANIANIMPLMKGMKGPEQENESIWFALDENTAIPKNCYEWVSKQIESSEEWIAMGFAADQTEPVFESEPDLPDESLPF